MYFGCGHIPSRGVVQSQKLKTNSYMSSSQSMGDLEKSHDTLPTGAQNELKKEMATLQKQIMMDTQEQGVASVRKSPNARHRMQRGPPRPLGSKGSSSCLRVSLRKSCSPSCALRRGAGVAHLLDEFHPLTLEVPLQEVTEIRVCADRTQACSSKGPGSGSPSKAMAP
ncbi:hypothetical protein QTO34_007808 [Cnephaeus nilssonii]|uniref:Uncharacterized protein n=1 Tax=Cnephaeus nilssonii TaxID=3371016 RepID=A0AA40HJ15_CNENI|nr:hypothetical protein QTO34_007808 [Eptesicus nilssonii]